MQCSVCGYPEMRDIEVRVPITRLTTTSVFNYIPFHWCPRCGTLYEKRSVAEIDYSPLIPTQTAANMPKIMLDEDYDAAVAGKIVSEYTELFGENLLNYLIDLERDIGETYLEWANRNIMNPLYQYEYVQLYSNVIFLDNHIKKALCFTNDSRVLNKEFYQTFIETYDVEVPDNS